MEHYIEKRNVRNIARFRMLERMESSSWVGECESGLFGGKKGGGEGDHTVGWGFKGGYSGGTSRGTRECGGSLFQEGKRGGVSDIFKDVKFLKIGLYWVHGVHEWGDGWMLGVRIDQVRVRVIMM